MQYETFVSKNHSQGLGLYWNQINLSPTDHPIGPDGIDYDPQVVHEMTVANLHGEFCTSLRLADAKKLLASHMPLLSRVQGKE